jgi:hypothetical protein
LSKFNCLSCADYSGYDKINNLIENFISMNFIVDKYLFDIGKLNVTNYLTGWRSPFV